MDTWVRRLQRRIDYALAVMVILLTASALSTAVEDVVGWAVVVVVVLLAIRLAWPHTVSEWRKDRALVREVGRWDDPRCPILLINPDGSETLVKPDDPAYPPLVDRATAATGRTAQTSHIAAVPPHVAVVPPHVAVVPIHHDHPEE